MKNHNDTQTQLETARLEQELANLLDDEPAKKASLRLDYAKTVNFAAQQNGARLIYSLTVEAGQPLFGATVRISSNPAFILPIEVDGLNLLEGSNSIDITDAELSSEYFSALTEREKGHIEVELLAQGRVVAREHAPVDLLAFDEFAGEESSPAYLASFCLPNAPAVTNVLSDVSRTLSKDNIFLKGYKSPPEEIAKELAALYAVLKSKDIKYVLPPASFEGQRIRFPDTIENKRIATCLDLSLYVAAIGEAMGLNPLVFVYNDHAFVGFWLVEGMLPECVSDDISAVRKRIPAGVNEIMAFETTMLTHGKSDFVSAVSEAAQYLTNKKGFCFTLDIARCRKAGILPLPVRAADGTIIKAGKKQVKEQTPRVLTTHMPSAQPREQTRFDKWKKDLLDISLTNPLINFSPRSGIPILAHDLEEIEDSLMSENALGLFACPSEIKAGAGLFDACSNLALKGILSADLKLKRLRTSLSEKELASKATSLFRTARTSEEETGANVLFLALGFLKFIDDKKRETHYSPIMLLPVEMSRKSAASGYSIKIKGDEAQINPSLIEMLESGYGIDARILEQMPLGESGVDVRLLLSTVRRLIMTIKGWDVIEAASLGIFQYAKFVLLNDLKSREREVKAHPVVASLISGRLSPELLKETESTEVFLPLSADATQRQAICDATAGKTFVLHGPPGTGKSQTITNIIVNSLANGKRVLFVAEKIAALDVVKSRLERLGLFDFCLEMHSNKTNKKHILSQFESLLTVHQRAERADYADALSRLNMAAAELDDFRGAMHDTRQQGCSVYEGVEQFYSADIDCDLPALDVSSASGKDRAAADEILSTMLALGEELGSPSSCVFSMCSPQPYTPALKNEVFLAATELCNSYDALDEAITWIGSGLDEGDIRDYDILKPIADTALEIERQEEKGAFMSFFSRFGQKHRSVRQLGYYDKLQQLKEQDAARFNRSANALKVFFEAESRLSGCLGYGLHFASYVDYAFELKSAAEQFLSSLSILSEYCAYSQARQTAADIVFLRPVSEGYHDGTYSAQLAVQVFKKAFAAAFLDLSIKNDPVLFSFTDGTFKNLLARYTALSEIEAELSKKEVYRRIASRIPQLSKAAAATSEPGILLRAIHSGGRGMPIRKLLDRIPELLARAKPCMLMSPLSAAQYLPEGFEQFDIVVFDEASQLITGEAVGALSRGRSAVVVGDPKQLPPTTFFAQENDEEDDDGDLESLLDDILTIGLPEHYLLWHYRSAHESLITFSNVNFYNSKLVTFPSTDDAASRVSFEAVSGVYDRGASRTNKAEAEAVVDALFESLQKNPSASHGIIAFSSAQATAIENLIDSRLVKNPSLEKHFSREVEPVFVKNIENVQGDERDIIFFSVGYGKDKDGKMSLNFGPINKQGGWRRLNVAVTRSRREMRVFSTITAEDINLARTASEGAAALKSFLRYAQYKTTPLSREGGEQSPLVGRLERALNAAGYRTAAQVGKSINKIDLAVVSKADEQRYMAGILLDGRCYGSNHSTRDRELLRESVLKNMGWKLTRVFASQVYQEEQRTLDRLLEFVEGKTAEGGHAQLKKTIQKEIAPTKKVEAEHAPVTQYKQTPLKRCKQSVFYADASLPIIKTQIRAVIDAEAPVSKAIIVKRISDAWGFARSSPKLEEHVTAQLNMLRAFYNTSGSTQFYWKSKQDAENYSQFRELGGRSADDLSKEELAVAAAWILKQSLSIEEDDLIKETAKAFSLQKTPSNSPRIAGAVALLIKRGAAVKDGTMLRLL